MLVSDVAAHATSLFSHYQKRRYDMEQGLPGNDVSGIAQTPDGYLWFTTRDGLARFDGQKFTIFRAENTPGLASNAFAKVITDRAGRLWLGGSTGVVCYQNGTFKQYNSKNGLPKAPVQTIFEDRSGILWFGTWGGLVSFDGERFRTFTTADGLPDNVVAAIADDASGGIWVGGPAGLARFADGHFHIFTTRDGLPSNHIDDLLLDHSGRLWIGLDIGVAKMAAIGQFRVIKELTGNFWSFFEDRDGAVWASSTARLLARLAPGDSHFQREPVLPGERSKVTFEDREGNIWIGTPSSGVICYRRRPFVTYTTRDGLADNKVLNFYQDTHGALWIGTIAGLSEFSAGMMHSIRAKALRNRGEIHAITEDHSGSLWVGTENGVVRFNGQHWEPIKEFRR